MHSNESHTDRGKGPGSHRNGEQLHVLIVEDQPDTAESTALLLELCGHRVRVATDGPTALRLAQAELPQVILLDLGLPQMNGFEIAQAIRSWQTPRRPVIIAITGYGQEADRLRSTQAGIDLHLLKPVSPQELQTLLQSLQAGRNGNSNAIVPADAYGPVRSKENGI